MSVELKFCENNYPIISEEILTLLNIKTIDNELVKGTYFNEDLTYNWNEISINLSDINTQGKDLLTCVQRLQPVWQSSLAIFEKFKNCNRAKLAEQLYWIGDYSGFEDFCFGETSKTSCIENVLLLTALIEYGLGNVFYTKTQTSPPHLLRDLLDTSIIENVFGKFPIFFLKILIGTPKSVNLRNICWHGFPSVDDIPIFFPATLFLIIFTFSKHLKTINLEIQLRKKVQNITYLVDQIEIDINENHIINEIQSKTIVKNSNYIRTEQIEFWEQIYTYYMDGCYQKCLVLILPQIELLLRILYGTINKIDISAKIHQYYIILDTVFEEILPITCTQNRFLVDMNKGTLKLLYDLFISPNGPRIRDKTSHGEIDYSIINKKICSILLYLSLAIMNYGKCEETSLKNYESAFHNNSTFYNKLKITTSNLNKVKSIEIPHDICDKLDWNENYTQLDGLGMAMRFFDDLKCIEIFTRPKTEEMIVSILHKISDAIQLTCYNITSGINNRIELFKARQLRSKRRQTLQNTIISLPTIWGTLELINNITAYIFTNSQLNGYCYLEENFSDIMKLLKKALKTAENLKTCCDSSKNEWEKAINLCKIFVSTVETCDHVKIHFFNRIEI